MVVLVGLTWSFFQHLLSGSVTWSWTAARRSSSRQQDFAVLTIVGSALLTALVWFYLLGAEMSLGDSTSPLGKVRGLGSARHGGDIG